MKEKIVFLLSVFMVGILSVIFIPRLGANEETVANNNLKQLIIIDAGHGGFDGGAVADDGTEEKIINLKIVKKLRSFVLQFGFNCILTRSTDISTCDETSTHKKASDIYNRLKLAKNNKNSIFLSIHMNKYQSSSIHGAQVFYSTNDDLSPVLANCIQTSIINNVQSYNTRKTKPTTDAIYLLHNATTVSVLVECGFLSNAEELRSLKQSNYQNRMAFSVLDGLMSFQCKRGKSENATKA